MYSEIITIFLIGLSLTADTFAVSITTGLSVSKIRFNQAIRVAAILAIFQGAMPIIGWTLGINIKEYIANYDHWIAFILLAFIGGKMVYESFKNEEIDNNINRLKLFFIVSIAVATSIDALVIGVGFAIMNIKIWVAATIIAALTFIVSMLGMLIGKKTSNLLGKKMEIIGGIILFAIGLKILIQHLFFK